MTTKFRHNFSVNLILKATLIPLQRKTIVNASHTPVLFIKKQTKNTTIWQSIVKSGRACSKKKQFKVVVLSRYFIGGR